jgi:predicted CXXCH cytochrome family protein
MSAHPYVSRLLSFFSGVGDNITPVGGFSFGELTPEATAFRNHNDNLHYLHVNRQSKGSVCKSCHGVHGAAQDKLLLAKTKSFGRWAIQLTWVSDGSRATCYVGCHRPKTYDLAQGIKKL